MVSGMTAAHPSEVELKINCSNQSVGPRVARRLEKTLLGPERWKKGSLGKGSTVWP